MNQMTKQEKLFETHFRLCEKAFALMKSKNNDYANSDDPFANFRASNIIAGVDPAKGIMIRLSDKLARIKTFLDKGSLNNESFEDSIVDSMNYLVLLYELVQDSNDLNKPIPMTEDELIEHIKTVYPEVLVVDLTKKQS